MEEKRALTRKETLYRWGKYLGVLAVVLGLFYGGLWWQGGKTASDHALASAELQRSEVSFLRFSLDLEDFLPLYEVSWYHGGREVEYTVHALTGEILEIDT